MSSEFYDFMNEIKTDEVLGLVLILLLIILGISLIVGVFRIIYTWKLFKKAGKGGWEALIPYYNKWVLTEISEVNWWWFLILVFAPMFSVGYNIGSSYSEDPSIAFALVPIAMALSVGEISKQHSRYPGYYVGYLQLNRIVGVEYRKYACVIHTQADDSREASHYQIIYYFFVFAIQVFSSFILSQIAASSDRASTLINIMYIHDAPVIP